MNTTPLLRPLSIGEILDGAFSIYRQYFTRLVGLALVVTAPAFVVGLAASLVGDDPLGLVLLVVNWLLSWPASFLMIGAYLWMTSEIVMGRSPTMGRAIVMGFKKLFPVMLISLLIGILVGAAFMPAVFGGILAANVHAALGIGVGLLLLVPAVYVLLVFALGPAIVVVEGRWDVLRRSPQLARGATLKIGAVILLYTILMSLPFTVVAAAAGVMGQLEQITGSTVPSPGVLIATTALTALTSCFGQICLALLYFDQRVRKEGLDVEVSTARIDG